jgi:outer membrane murein-binding lipoprotein Lpp
MKQIKLFTAAIAVAVLLITGCKKETPDELQSDNTSAAQSNRLSTDLKTKLTRLRSSLPAGYEKRLTQNTRLFLKTHPEYRYMVLKSLHAIEPTACNDNTQLNQWLGQQLADWNDEVIFYALATGMLDFPTYDALLFENSSSDQYFGTKGQYTHSVTKTFKDLQRFWNIETNDIQLVAMHGNMLLNRDKIIRIDMILYGDSPADAAAWADLIITLMNEVPQYRRGNHPIFTFNAFAQPSFEFPPYGIVPDKIVMGDGIMDAYAAIGYGDVAPQAILAHEFGHHIQFQLDLFEDENSPEATRRTELMADAYAAYYLSHARGASMQWKRVQQFLQVFFNIGDCAFTDEGHHGTPTQRMAAAEWGYSVADNAQKQGHILSAQEFTAMFEAQLPQILSH